MLTHRCSPQGFTIPPPPEGGGFLEKFDELIKNCVVEIKDEKGRWVKSDELKIDYIDILTGNILD